MQTTQTLVPCDIVLRDGSTLRIRQAAEPDVQAVLALLHHLSPQSLYNRFGAAHRPTDNDAAIFCGVGSDGGLALVAERAGRVVAAAQYCRNQVHRHRAEVAFTVDDAFQGRGVGTRLLELLAGAARRAGITTFEAFLLTSNRSMREVFAESGFEIRGDTAQGYTHVELSLTDTPAHEDRAARRGVVAATASMQPFFRPRAVAVVGASRARGRIGSEILHNVIGAGFRGSVFPVNAHASVLEGMTCYPSVSAIPGDVDLAIVAVPAACVEGVVDDCVAKGVRALVVITAGFSETGAAGRELEGRVLAKVRAAGIRMIGPNCMGILNTDPAVRLDATFAPSYPPAGRVAFSSQSGALGLAILDYARRLNLGLSTFVSVGNKADVSSNDLLQYWAEDDRTDVILLYLESFGNPRKFSQIARHIGRRKPIIAVKAGRSASGARAASSHTGALAASDTIVDALFRQAGVIRTDTLEELFDVATLVAHQPLPAGSRVAVLSNAGGPGILAADACEAHGLALPTLGDGTVAALRAFLPAAASVSNPVDMLATASADDYARAIPLLLADPGVDALMVLFIPPLVTSATDVANAVVAATSGASKPVLATFLGAEQAPALAALPCYQFPESAARALAHAVDYAHWRATPEGTIPRFEDLDPDRAREIVARALDGGGGWLAPADVNAILAAFGITIVPTVAVQNEDAAVQAARRVGLPVAVKGSGPNLLHKTDAHAVLLDLADEEAVRAAYRDLETRLGSRISHVLVQPMVAHAPEMFVGATFDPTFGHVVLCGSGGTLLELVHDVSCGLHPLTDVVAQQMLNDLRGIAVVRGYRGATPGDEGALRELLLRVSALVDACPEIRELDLNPVMVHPVGVVAVDARIRVDREAARTSSRRVEY